MTVIIKCYRGFTKRGTEQLPQTYWARNAERESCHSGCFFRYDTGNVMK